MSVDRNLAAGFLANAWTALVQIAFIPVYVRLLGVEAYGLIGVYAVLQSALVVLDLGFAPTLNREAARAGPNAQALRPLLRSVEVVLAVVAAAVLAAALAVAPALARDWLQPQGVTIASAVSALELMGALIAVRLFIGAHRAVVAGSQRLVWLNGVGALFATLRGAGVIPVLWARPSIEAFFAWQLAVTVIEAVVTARFAWGLLGGTTLATFSTAALRGVAGFSIGLAVATLVSLAMSQADKVFLSAMAPLAEFGYYALASAVASALLLVVAPVGSVAYPRLNQLATGERAPLVAAFHDFASRMTVAVAPAALVLALFAEPLLLLWTADPATRAAAVPLALLALGAMLNAFAYMPYAITLAHGRARRVAFANAGLLALFLPALYLGIRAHGAVAAAAGWLLVNAVGVAVAFAIAVDLDRRERLRWLVADVLAPAGAAAAAAALVRAVFDDALRAAGPAAAAAIVLAGAGALGAALLARRVISSRA